MPIYNCEQFRRDPATNQFNLGLRTQHALDLFTAYRIEEGRITNPLQLATVFQTQLTSALSGIVLLTEDSSPIGIATLSNKPGNVRVYRLAYIEPTRRGQGLFRILTDCVEDLARSINGSVLEALPINPRAEMHLRSRGYKQSIIDGRRLYRRLS